MVSGNSVKTVWKEMTQSPLGRSLVEADGRDGPFISECWRAWQTVPRWWHFQMCLSLLVLGLLSPRCVPSCPTPSSPSSFRSLGALPFSHLAASPVLGRNCHFFFFQLSSYCSEYWCFFVIKKALKTPLFLLNILSTRRSKSCAPVHLSLLGNALGGGEGGWSKVFLL